MQKNLLTALIGTALALPFVAQAQGFYAGANLGRAEQKLSVDGYGSLKDSDTGYKLYGGYDYTQNVGAEVGYVDLGKAGVSDGIDTVSNKPRSIYVAVTGTLPLNAQFSLTGKVGVSHNHSTIGLDGYGDTSLNETTALFGIGAAYHFSNKASAVLEYESFGKVLRTDGINVKANLISLGLRYKF